MDKALVKIELNALELRVGFYFDNCCWPGGGNLFNLVMLQISERKLTSLVGMNLSHNRDNALILW